MGMVVALTGQVGGAKLVDGLYHLRGQDLVAIVNTGDDYEHLTLPDFGGRPTPIVTHGQAIEELAGVG